MNYPNGTSVKTGYFIEELNATVWKKNFFSLLQELNEAACNCISNDWSAERALLAAVPLSALTGLTHYDKVLLFSFPLHFASSLFSWISIFAKQIYLKRKSETRVYIWRDAGGLNWKWQLWQEGGKGRFGPTAHTLSQGFVYFPFWWRNKVCAYSNLFTFCASYNSPISSLPCVTKISVKS